MLSTAFAQLSTAPTDSVITPSATKKSVPQYGGTPPIHEKEPFARLTDRERDTLQALARGRTVHEIANSWVLSEATVRTHVRSVLAKLNVPSQLAAVSLALRSGWIDSTARVMTGPPPEHPGRRATDLFTV